MFFIKSDNSRCAYLYFSHLLPSPVSSSSMASCKYDKVLGASFLSTPSESLRLVEWVTSSRISHIFIILNINTGIGSIQHNRGCIRLCPWYADWLLQGRWLARISTPDRWWCNQISTTNSTDTTTCMFAVKRQSDCSTIHRVCSPRQAQIRHETTKVHVIHRASLGIIIDEDARYWREGVCVGWFSCSSSNIWEASCLDEENMNLINSARRAKGHFLSTLK